MPQAEPASSRADVTDVIRDAVVYDVETGSVDTALDEVFEAFVRILKTHGRTRFEAELLLADIRQDARHQFADFSQVDWSDAIRSSPTLCRTPRRPADRCQGGSAPHKNIFGDGRPGRSSTRQRYSKCRADQSDAGQPWRCKRRNRLIKAWVKRPGRSGGHGRSECR
jgi:hypothetical protein